VHNGEAEILERWPRAGDTLVEALKAPIVGRFAGFAGQAPNPRHADLDPRQPDRRDLRQTRQGTIRPPGSNGAGTYVR
jgi:hypothetical protein